MSVPRILLIVGGGIAAYKSCELVRLIRKAGGDVTCVLTDGGSKFVTAMTLAALSENPVYTTLWDLQNEVEMGHIQLSRAADLVVVCPATADLMAKMAAGIADDLATTLLLATDKPVMAVPAMNVRMWQHAATMRNVATLRDSGVFVMEPDDGAMACGEFGPGRLPEPVAIWAEIAGMLELAVDVPDEFFSEAGDLGGLSGSMIPRVTKASVILLPNDETFDEVFDEGDLPIEEAPPPLIDLGAPPLLMKKGKAVPAPPTDPDAINEPRGDFAGGQVVMADPLEGQPDFAPDDPAHPEPVAGPLHGKHILITAGPTHEPIDPVRYIANRSSGKQGYAIAAAAARAGARVTLVSGPVTLPTPPGVDRIDVETAREMATAVDRFLPADVGILVAAVADWRSADFSGEKLKKRHSAPPALRLTENPDILAGVSAGAKRPKLLIGFAAETQDVVTNAREKRKRKGVDWIIANDVSGDVMGGEANTVHIVTAKGIEYLNKMSKDAVAEAIIERIISELA